MLPGPPAYAHPVTVPPPVAGEHVSITEERERRARRRANEIIRAVVRDWRAMQSTYARAKP